VALAKIKKAFILSVQIFICLLLVFLTAFFGWQFFMQSRLPYNEMGRYFDEEKIVVYHEQAVPFYGLLLAISLVALIVTCRWTFKTFRAVRSSDLTHQNTPDNP
jgi:energy-coupling factor transporter transmembrane protein EcfT